MGNRLNHSARKRPHYWYKAFLLGLFFSAAFFIPYIVIGHGYFLYYGDFNVQQVPFYQLVHDAVRNGEWQWSYTTDLGTSLIGSYTFYLLGSPFFWLTLPFPSEYVPYLMGPLLILKFGTASLTGYIYLRRYARHGNTAVIGGLLYAFSGFSVYNIFFNHFHEAIIVFPLLLAAIDEYMYRKRRGVVALAVFAACFVNYYFFVGMVAFVVIYWGLKMYIGSWKLRFKDFLPLALEVLVGFLATMVILLPTVLFVSQNPRINDWPEGYGALLYGSEQRYLHIISSFFFPPDIPARPNFTPDSNSKWASVAAWLPMFGMTGVIAFLQSGSKSWLKKLLPFLLLCTMVPILNAIFQLFVMSYYARWFYMLTLMMSLATVLAIENSRTDWRRAINLTALITLFIACGIGLMPNGNDAEGASTLDTIGLEKYSDRFWIYVAIAMFSLALVTLLIGALKKNRKTFYPKAVACIGLVAVVYSGYIVGLGKSHSYDVDNFIIPDVIDHEDLEMLEEEDFTTFRSDFFETMDNVGMFWQIPTIQTFHSIVPGSVYEFYPSAGVTRDVGSRPEPKYYGLRSLLSVKYLFDYAYDDDEFENDEGKTRMPGYKYVDTQNSFKIYENKNYIPYGFYFDSYITEDQYYGCTEDNRHLLLLKAMVLNDEQAEKYGDLMTHITDTGKLVYGSDSFAKDCAALKENTCSKFEYGNGSFTARITTPQGNDKLVFFSIPYEKGWSAKVNGKSVEVEKVDIGFMAVRVPGGQMSDIEFTYRTPGLFEGAVISVVSVLIYIVYIILSAKNHKLRPRAKMKKKYKVSAFGSADELGERYKNLTVGKNAMDGKPTFSIKADENDTVDGADNTFNLKFERSNDYNDTSLENEKSDNVTSSDSDGSEIGKLTLEKNAGEETSASDAPKSSDSLDDAAENKSDNSGKMLDNETDKASAEKSDSENKVDSENGNADGDSEKKSDKPDDGIIIGDLDKVINSPSEKPFDEEK